MKQAYTTLALLCVFSGILRAQQDPMLTNFYFNKLSFNPACAGTDEHLSLYSTHRRQWLGFEGAPVTQTLGAHLLTRNKKVGLGLALANDRAGGLATYDVYPSYAYHLKMAGGAKLSIGLQAGVSSWHADWFDVTLEHQGDDVFNTNVNTWKANFGAGIFYYKRNFYAGVSCPRMVENQLLREKDSQTPSAAKNYRHYYLMAGGAIPLDDNEQWVFRPGMVLKTTGLFSNYRTEDTRFRVGSPAALDLSASLLIREVWWTGISYRSALQFWQSSSESLDVFFALHLRNGLRLGASYDLVINQLRKYNSGSIEVMLGYEFDIKVSRIYSPRYF